MNVLFGVGYAAFLILCGWLAWKLYLRDQVHALAELRRTPEDPRSIEDEWMDALRSEVDQWAHGAPDFDTLVKALALTMRGQMLKAQIAYRRLVKSIVGGA